MKKSQKMSKRTVTDARMFDTIGAPVPASGGESCISG
jgi:hypothetical protein